MKKTANLEASAVADYLTEDEIIDRVDDLLSPMRTPKYEKTDRAGATSADPLGLCKI